MPADTNATHIPVQAQSDLVKQLQSISIGRTHPVVQIWIEKAADHIEALEAVVAQPSQREAALVKAAQIVSGAYSARGPYSGFVSRIMMDVLENALAAYTPAVTGEPDAPHDGEAKP